MINRYRWYEIVGIYCGIAVFLTFVLAPFVEGFLVSLKPLSLLFVTVQVLAGKRLLRSLSDHVG